MKRQEILVLFKNAVSNVLRGASATVVALVVPPFLTRYMATNAFGTWSLILQLAAYISYLDFGIQIALARFVADATETGDPQKRDSLVSTCLAVLAVCAVIAVLFLGVCAFWMQRMFPQMPADLVHDGRVGFLLVGASLALGLPASVFGGALVGLQRNEIPAAIIGGSKLVTAIFLILAVRQGANIAQMGAITAAVNVVSYAAQYLAFRGIVRDGKLRLGLVTTESVKELVTYCAGVSVWLLGMLVISGLDLAIVGYFDFKAVAYYAVAAGAITVIVGVQNAVFSAMISSAAVLHARGNSAELGNLVTSATRLGMFLLLVSGIPLFVYAGPIVALWMGHSYSASTAPILQWLVIANVIRLSLTPYSVAVLATGQQSVVLLSPTLEAITNLTVSVVAGYFLGAIGVAIGTFVGGIVGIGVHILHNIRRTTPIGLTVGTYVESALVLPAVCSLPIAIAAVATTSQGFSLAAQSALLLLGGVGTAVSVWRWGLKASEKNRIREWALGSA
jgi:O-antigen/teichoic acid export membrane protein